MRLCLLFLLIFTACAPEHSFKPEEELSVVENASENVVELAVPTAECECEYSSPMEVKLIFSKKTFSDERYKVDFHVEEKDGTQFGYSARLTKPCADDFEKKRTVPATLERKTSGTCNPIYVRPKDYPPECWN